MCSLVNFTGDRLVIDSGDGELIVGMGEMIIESSYNMNKFWEYNIKHGSYS